jgi:hypothetical protein
LLEKAWILSYSGNVQFARYPHTTQILLYSQVQLSKTCVEFVIQVYTVQHTTAIRYSLRTQSNTIDHSKGIESSCARVGSCSPIKLFLRGNLVSKLAQLYALQHVSSTLLAEGVRFLHNKASNRCIHNNHGCWSDRQFKCLFTTNCRQDKHSEAQQQSTSSQ